MDEVRRPARIELFTGPMFSGKTQRLILTMRTLREAGEGVQAFYPKMDTRDRDVSGESRLLSHGGLKEPAIAVDVAREILDHVEASTTVVVVDEIQFFDSSLSEVCHCLAGRGIRVIAAGLDRDFRGESFETVSDLAKSVAVRRLTAGCHVCCSPAEFTQRIRGDQAAPYDDPQILIGGPEMYQPRCREHYIPHNPSVPLDGESLGLGGQLDVTIPFLSLLEQMVARCLTGISHTPNPYDRERYEEALQDLADMMALFRNPSNQVDPASAELIYSDWRRQVESGKPDYVTPKSTAFGALFNEAGEILLTRRHESREWDLPGGWCDVGCAPAESAVREIYEETGIRAVPEKLVGVYYSRIWGFDDSASQFCFVFNCRAVGGELDMPRLENEEAAYFEEHNLPSLLPGIRRSIEHAFDLYRYRRQYAHFDYRGTYQEDA